MVPRMRDLELGTRRRPPTWNLEPGIGAIRVVAMTKVRLGLIGLGNIGQHHASYLTAGKVDRAELVAVTDAVASKLERYQSLKVFTDAEALIDSGCVDAVIIATPHYQHTT